METPKVILRKALEHKESGTLPFDLGSTKMSGISLIAYQNYLNDTGKQYLDPQPELLDAQQQLAKPSEAFLEEIGVHTRGVFPRPPASWTAAYRTEGEYCRTTDEWGIEWKMPRENGLYFDLCRSPLAQEEITEQDIRRFPWPDPQDPLRISTLKQQVAAIQKRGVYGLTMHGMTSGALEMALRLRGFENYFVDILTEPRLAEQLLDTIVDIKIEYWNCALSEVGREIDVAIEVDDLGTQSSLLISPDTYRTLVQPRHKRLFDAIRKKAPHIKIFLHSCGAVRPLIPALIDAGVDILNPVQLSAAGMDAAELKREFGHDLVFWGGGVDTQKTLPYGTPQQVKDEVRRRIEILSPGGGFVFNTIHNIQADVPPQNLEALFEVLEEYR